MVGLRRGAGAFGERLGAVGIVRVLLVAALVLALSVGSARADTSTTFTLSQICTTGSYGSNNVYVVPFGVTELRITAVGQAGNDAQTAYELATHGGGVGGSGEKVQATISVSAGETLYPADALGGIADYSTGGDPSPQFPPGNVGNGGEGVGVSRVPGRGCFSGPAHPLVVAGGGGGGGYGDYLGPGGTGGSAGSSAGGDGNPGDDNGQTAGAGGGGGTQSSGGGGGAAGHGGADLGSASAGRQGYYFGAGSGGVDGNGTSSGGGGGGGYYGGGGGGGSDGKGGGGGGGGSSYVDSGATNVTESSTTDTPGITFTPIGPSNTTPPVISGYPYRSKTLTTTTGTWTGTGPITYAYQWQDCTGVDANGYGTGCTDIPGAAGSTYVVQGSDLGKRLDVVVTGTDSTGPRSARSQATAVVAQYSGVIGGDGPLAYWRLGDAFDQSVMSDSSGNGHDGTYKNGATGTAGSPQPVYGVSGDGDTAAIFTGDGTYGYVNGLAAPQHAYTIELWVRPSDLSAAMIFQQGGAGAIWINASHQLAFRQIDNFPDSEIDYTLPAGFDPTFFHQVVATWDGHTATLYLDGTQVGQETASDPVSGASTIYLGYGTFAPWLRGYLDEAAYYGYALSSTQITTHYHADPPLHLPASAIGTGGSTHHHGATTAQKLKRALAKCRKLRTKHARAKCTAAAKTRYPPRK